MKKITNWKARQVAGAIKVYGLCDGTKFILVTEQIDSATGLFGSNITAACKTTGEKYRLA